MILPVGIRVIATVAEHTLVTVNLDLDLLACALCAGHAVARDEPPCADPSHSGSSSALPKLWGADRGGSVYGEGAGEGAGERVYNMGREQGRERYGATHREVPDIEIVAPFCIVTCTMTPRHIIMQRIDPHCTMPDTADCTDIRPLYSCTYTVHTVMQLTAG